MLPKTCLHDSSARMVPAHSLSPPEALVHVVPVLFAGPLAVPLGHTRQVSLCSPGVLCRCLPWAVLWNPSIVFWALLLIFTVLRVPCQTRPMRTGPFFAAPFLYRAAWTIL